MPTKRPLTAGCLLESWRSGQIEQELGDDPAVLTISAYLVWLRYAEVNQVARPNRTDATYRDLADLNDLRLYLARRETLSYRQSYTQAYTQAHNKGLHYVLTE